MDFVIESVKFHPFPVEFANFRQSKDQDIGRDLYKRGLRLQALARVSVPKRTGALAASIHVNYFRGASNPHVTIGSNLNYAYFVHEGTNPHTIRPKTGRVLRFQVNGRVVYAQKVHHPGTRAERYLSRHLRTVVR